MKYVKNIQKLRKQRLLAINALKKAGNISFKPKSSAKWTDISRNKNGCITVQIEHDDIKNVSPEMLKWWFEHLGCITSWNGADFSGPKVSLYHLWHHKDHICVTPLTDSPYGCKNLGFLENAKTRIHEQFNEYNDLIHFTMYTTKLNENEFTFKIMAGPLSVGHVKHTYERTDEGCSFYAETKIGIDFPVIGWIFNYLLRPFIYSKKSGENWILHNIEETGRTQDILPILYTNQDKIYFSKEETTF